MCSWRAGDEVRGGVAVDVVSTLAEGVERVLQVDGVEQRDGVGDHGQA